LFKVQITLQSWNQLSRIFQYSHKNHSGYIPRSPHWETSTTKHNIC